MTEAAEKARRFTRISLENWRNFGSVDVELQQRVFLIGPNGSGKSNLLDAFRFLRDVAAEGGGLRYAAAKRDGIRELRSRFVTDEVQVRLTVCMGSDFAPDRWRYELAIGEDERGAPVVAGEQVSHDGCTILRRPDDGDRRDPARQTQTHLEQVTANQPFREIADLLSSVDYLHIVPQLVRDRDRYVGVEADPFGADFIDRIASTPARTRSARLRRIRDALRIAVPQLADLELLQHNREPPHLRVTFDHWGSPRSWQTEASLSDGTLRLLGMLWALLDGSGPLLLEEPELSLHPDIVRYLPLMFYRVQARKGRQVLLSTHASELLADEGIGLDEVRFLEPGPTGTAVRPAGSLDVIAALVKSGMSLGQAAMPMAAPVDTVELALSGT